MKAVSIVVPTLNESENVSVLVRRIAKTFKDSGVTYEIIFIDDHSADGTVEAVQRLTKRHPVRLYDKIGRRGKAYSLLQGFNLAQYDTICMIDADLQYPPEAILPMYELLAKTGVDVVLTERQDEAATSKLRQLSSKVFNLAFTRLLFGFNYDAQSGLKLFRKEVITAAALNPSPWSFDLEFIVRALENDYKIISYKIIFSKRHSGHAKVKVAKVAYELMTASIKLRLKSSRRKIKQAYRLSMETANKTIGALILFGAVSGYTLLHPLNAGALVDTTEVKQSVEAIWDTTKPMPDIFKPADAPKPSTDDTSTGSNGTTRRSDAASPTRLPQKQSVSPVPDMAEQAGITYPLQNRAPSFIYRNTGGPLPIDYSRLWISSLAGVVVVAAAYEVITYRRRTK